ncbi:MAG: 3-dehydroquinate dehydratase [Deltaproteobacteria bacterium ADurb.BinA179]|jgi:3-dehydroquinate dehydratase-2|nr:type II 3-dehydroquinate dehydratase [Deltaproteobacteria bacterium]MDI9543144.1 type II 3-dehydroquinate dehydratase [Pseudomonadota bacterium]OPZ27665.1 MAG: 3-dehydroquinate dehydratase [Deltaproteobacteria bacterium ADurb.BinA179]HNU73896.1 type II 3-dehydroquinate dehydratase [Deltaproteobacteria bacterium]HOD69747.1 type II 3-dehydroquinate dehydratase [Deltaproteobacteria bacterium]
MKILMINGPNLNLLGTRETALYGRTSLPEIEARTQKRARELGIELEAFQSNHEGEIIEKIHAAAISQSCGILINPGGYTHTSVAIRDALLAVDIPFVEVHISNVAAREPFRQKNLFSDIALGTISGLGPYGYILGIEALHELLRTKNR